MLLRLFIFLPCLLFPVMTYAQDSPSPKLTRKLDSLMESEYQADRFHGTLAIFYHDKAYYQKAWGLANRVWNLPMQPHYRFDICSVNKSFICALVLLAEEEGKWHRRDKLVALLKQYAIPYSGSFHPDISLHQMMSHTAGLADYDGVAPNLSANHYRKFKRSHFQNDAYVDFISHLDALSTPGTKFYYSNFAYHILCILLEEAYQKDFDHLLQEKICSPLGLKHTFAGLDNREIFPQLVEAYNRSDPDDDKSWKRNEFIDLTLGRRIFSTSEDLALWAIALQNGSLLSPEMQEVMFSNQVKEVNPDISYGYGWAVFDGKKAYRMGNLGIDKQYIIHGGATEGFKSMLIRINQGEWTLAFLSNVGEQTRELALAQKIVHILNP